MHKYQLSSLYVVLGEVQDVSGGGALQGQVAVAGWRDDELQPVGRSVRVLCTKIIYGDFCHWTHPHLRKSEEGGKKKDRRAIHLSY